MSLKKNKDKKKKRGGGMYEAMRQPLKCVFDIKKKKEKKKSGGLDYASFSISDTFTLLLVRSRWLNIDLNCKPSETACCKIEFAGAF